MTAVQATMRQYSRSASLCLMLALAGTCESTAGAFNDFTVYFPQVVKGTLSGVYFESTLVISNGGPDAVEIGLSPFGLSLPGSGTFQLPGHRTLEVKFSGEPFQAGRIRLTYGAYIAMAFAATALYFRGTELASASVIAVDEAASYGVFLKSSVNADEQADQLAGIYGFEVRRFREIYFEAIMTNEVARAVARDKRVEEVYPNALGVLSP